MVTHQLQVERRTGKVRRPETDVLPLCHATTNVRVRVTILRFSSVSLNAQVQDIIVTPPSNSEAEYCDERACVCLSVCVFVCSRSYLRNYTSDLRQFFVHVTYGRGSVFLWRRSAMLYASGFTDLPVSQGYSTSQSS